MSDPENKLDKKGKYVPSLSQLRGVVNKLPDPATTLDATITVNIDDQISKPIEFERIIIKKSDGGKSAKWSYKEGVENRFQKRKTRNELRRVERAEKGNKNPFRASDVACRKRQKNIHERLELAFARSIPRQGFR